MPSEPAEVVLACWGPEAVASPRPSWRDRVLGVLGVTAVALAIVRLGGLGGAALGAVSDGGETGRGGPGMVRQLPGGPGRVQPVPPRELLPTTPPDDDSRYR